MKSPKSMTETPLIPTICACDPDSNTPAFALFEDGKLTQWIILPRNKAPRSQSAYSWLIDVPYLAEQWSPDILVIENQYLPPNTGNSRAQSVFTLVASRGMITACFLIAGVPVRLVEPFKWQRSLGGSKQGRDALKQQSMLKASDIAGCPIINHNIADAINIGYFWVMTSRVHVCAAPTGGYE